MVRIGLDAVPLVGVLDQEADAPRQRVGGRLGAADVGVGHQLGVQLLVREAAAPLRDRGVDEVGQQRVVGLHPEPLEDRLEVVLRLDLHLGRPDPLLRRLHQPEPLHPGVGPRLDPPDVLGVGTHLHADHDEWERHGELPDELALAGVDELVDELVGQVADHRFECGDARRPERVTEQRSHLAVVRVVAAGERGRRHPALLLVERHHVGRQAATATVRRAVVHEPFGVLQHGSDVVVAGDDVGLQPVVEPDWRLVAQRAIRAVRAVVDGRIEEVDGVEWDRRIERCAVDLRHRLPQSVRTARRDRPANSTFGCGLAAQRTLACGRS